MRGIIKVIVSKDMMQAKVRIDNGDTFELTEETILHEIEEHGIKAGIKKDAIKQLLEMNPYGKEFVVAEGKASTPGESGKFEFFFDTEKKKYKPVIKEDGTVDYSVQRELVKKGDVLAKYHPPKQGNFGYTVFASMVAPIPMKELPPLHMYGVTRTDDLYYAACSGEVSYKDDTLAVNSCLVIDGDASNVTGAIKFTGDIHVRGDVIAGVHIVAEGDVQVDGVVEGAQIEAGKDIIIKQGIHGQGKAVLRAKGSVYSAFIEEAEVYAEDSITFNYACNCKLHAEKCIIAEGRMGNIMGGLATAKESISVKTLGNESEIRTRLQILPDEESKIDQRCYISVEKEFYDGSEIKFHNVYFEGRNQPGEYHIVRGIVKHYECGAFVYEVEPIVEVVDEKKLILLVDDEPMILKTFYSYLCQDYKVMAVNSAQDAFTLMENKLPDLILLDYRMPNMNGGQMLERMRYMTWKWYCNVPVMFATAVTEKSIVEKCLSQHPQGYLIKPLGKEELLEVVNKFFASNQ